MGNEDGIPQDWIFPPCSQNQQDARPRSGCYNYGPAGELLIHMAKRKHPPTSGNILQPRNKPDLHMESCPCQHSPRLAPAHYCTEIARLAVNVGLAGRNFNSDVCLRCKMQAGFVCERKEDLIVLSSRLEAEEKKKNGTTKSCSCNLAKLFRLRIIWPWLGISS